MVNGHLITKELVVIIGNEYQLNDTNNFKELAPWVSQKSAQHPAELGPAEATK